MNSFENSDADSSVVVFFTHHIKMKMFHFQTSKYAAHVAIDVYLNKYRINFDRFMEVWQGDQGKLTTKDVSINFKTFGNINSHLDQTVDFLSKMKELQGELSSIRDEMVADILQLKYLLMFD